jgi:putative tricarboxylic transport membrane protein
VRKSEIAAAALLLLLGAATIFQSRTLSYWHEQAPGPAFVPFWLGVLLIATAAILLIAAIRAPAARSAPSAPFAPSARFAPGAPMAPRAPAWISAFSVLALVLIPIVGMPLACGLFMAATLFLLEPRRRWRNIITAVATVVIVSLLFVHGLGVPLPLGPLGF